jgi:NAD+ synthase (glutamine-hydrolysing)
MEKKDFEKPQGKSETDHICFTRLVKISSCTLNQWAMDFEGNKNRIIQTLKLSKDQGCKIRIGPELEIPGYGCEDHFLELDTVYHSWEILAEIINHPDNLTENMLCDIGMPVAHNGIIYNCRVIVFNKQILLIRPKIAMADDGNYRENRWFTPWMGGYVLQEFILPQVIYKTTHQSTTQIGIGIIKARDLSYFAEICEELWIPHSPSVDASMCGAEIIGNSSGSHFQILKQERRYELIVNLCKKNGGVHAYSNLIGCDGGRLYFDGGSFITLNGRILAEGSRFTLDEYEIVTAVADLNDVVSYRNSIKSRCQQSSQNSSNMPIIHIDEFILQTNHRDLKYDPFFFIQPTQYTFEREMQFAPSCWMWDYLRRSGAAGYFLALSGGADSGCVATMVGLLCRMIFSSITIKKNEFVLNELRKIVKEEDYYPKSAQEICN